MTTLQVFSLLLTGKPARPISIVCLLALSSLAVSTWALPHADDVLQKRQQLESHSVLNDSTHAREEYRLTLSSLRKVNGEIVAERELRIDAKVSRTTIEFERSVSAVEAWSTMRKVYRLQPGIREIYGCSGLSCGSSNYWANERFQVKQLYGLDQSQHYLVLELPNAKSSDPTVQGALLVLYFVQRGNHRTYAQMDYISPNQSMPKLATSHSAVTSTLKDGGRYVIAVTGSQQQDAFADGEFQALLKSMKVNPFFRFSLVGVSASGAEKGQELAAWLSAKLQASGIRENRLILDNQLGVAADNAWLPAERVEIRLQK